MKYPRNNKMRRFLDQHRPRQLSPTQMLAYWAPLLKGATVEAEKTSLDDARVRLGAKFDESVLFRAALEQGYGAQSEDKARELYQIYVKSGFTSLPAWTKKIILDICEGHHSHGACSGCEGCD